MNDTALSRNRHPVDRLADVRTQIKVLEQEEADLKAQITTEMGSGDSLGGDEYIAFQSLQTRRGSLDEAKLRPLVGDLAAFRKPETTFIVLKVEPRVREVS